MTRAPTVVVAIVATSLLGVTALLGGADVPLARHLYFAPVAVAALRLGLAGGLATAAAGVLLHAPLVLPRVEVSGLGAAAAEALVTFGLLVLVGAGLGGASDRARREHARYQTVLAAQRALAGEAEAELTLRRLRACLLDRLDVADLALVVRDGPGLVMAGADRLTPVSLAGLALAAGEPMFAPAAGRGPRVRRAFAAPLTAGDETIGVLVVERVGELTAAERRVLTSLGAHLGLALENARLAALRRRFNDELAERVAAATRRLEEADRAKSAFVAIASHELRTPLTALQGFSELLALRRFAPEEVQRLAGILHRETERLVRIVADLLDLSRLDRGQPPSLARRALEVGPAIESAVELFRRGVRGHRIEVDCGEPLPPLDADPDAVDRILKNLVSNAIKYSAPDSVVTVSARFNAVRHTVDLAVEDQGRGIPPEALPRIFEPYYRAPDAVGAAPGTGIGLAVVKWLVEAHGGAVEVVSAPAVGTRVTLAMPAIS
jgi:signal transduction histidine kinase